MRNQDQMSEPRDRVICRCVSAMHAVGIQRVFWTTTQDGEWEGATVRDMVDAPEVGGGRVGTGQESKGGFRDEARGSDAAEGYGALVCSCWFDVRCHLLFGGARVEEANARDSTEWMPRKSHCYITGDADAGSGWSDREEGGENRSVSLRVVWDFRASRRCERLMRW